MDDEVHSCKSRYERLETHRYVFLDRARQCSELTIPTLIPPLGHTHTTKYYTPWQSIGSRGVNNLASKLLLSLFPANSPFFKLAVDDATLMEIAGTPEARAQVEEGLGKIERAVAGEIEASGMRSQIFLALKHLIVGGNVLLYLPKEGGVRIFGIDSYVAIRDPKGNLMEVIIKERVNVHSLNNAALEELHAAQEGETVKEEKEDHRREGHDHDADEEIDIYTRYWRDGGRWRMYQEAYGKVIPGSDGSWPLDRAPMICLRWNTVEGEDYGRSYVEEYLGDLVSLEALSKAIVEASASVSKIVWLVSPNGVTKARDITESESGDAIVGHKDDVHCLQSDKQADMKVTYEAANTISKRLSYAFLLNSSVQRSGERVTAEEIRFVASELEDALGGVYSILSQEFQLPLCMRVMDRMQKDKRLPDLPKDVVKPMITTGLAALGRGQDLRKYQMLMEMLKNSPEAMQRIKIGNLVTRIGTALMIDMDGLVKSDEEVAQETAMMQQAQQQQQMADLAGKAAPAAIKAMADRMPAGQAPAQ